MLEFEILQELEPKGEILEIIKDYDLTIRNGKIKHLKTTNLQFIEPVEYLITYASTLIIFEYKVNEIANKNFSLVLYKTLGGQNGIKRKIGIIK